MINRLIYNSKVYYKVNDLKEVYDNKVSMYKIKKVIKEQEIKTTKLKGYGNSNWIEEADLCMIEVDGSITVMETKIKDRKDTMNTNASMISLMNVFRGENSLSNEEMIEELMNKTDEDMTNFVKEYEPNKANNLTVETLNKELEQFGYEERAIGIEVLYKNGQGDIATEVISVLVDNDNNIKTDMDRLSYSYREDYSNDVEEFKIEAYEEWAKPSLRKYKGDWLKSNLSDGMISIGEGEVEIRLKKGKTKHRTDEEVIKMIMEILKNGDIESNVSEMVYVKINEDGEDIGLNDFAYMRLLKGEFKIVCIHK